VAVAEVVVRLRRGELHAEHAMINTSYLSVPLT